MSQVWLEDAISRSGLPAAREFPRDLLKDVSWGLSLAVTPLSVLSTQRVRDWLAQRGIHHPVSEQDRALHGCLVARWGHGFVFLDADDDENERRFTLAHEVSHFILDHLLPRLRALKVLGKRILPVLNGERAPSDGEALSAVLERVRLDVEVHLMSRDSHGAVCTWEVEESEQRADRLAFELLAPADIALAALRDGGAHDGRLPEGKAVLAMATRFGLPTAAAGEYARVLLSRHQRKPTLSEELFGRA